MWRCNKNKREYDSNNGISEENTIGWLFEVLKSRPKLTTYLSGRLLNQVQHRDS